MHFKYWLRKQVLKIQLYKSLKIVILNVNLLLLALLTNGIRTPFSMTPKHDVNLKSPSYTTICVIVECYVTYEEHLLWRP